MPLKQHRLNGSGALLPIEMLLNRTTSCIHTLYRHLLTGARLGLLQNPPVIGNGLGVDRLHSLAHAKSQIMILAALKTLTVSAHFAKKFLREKLEMIDIHEGAQQLRTVIRFVHPPDEKAVGINLDLIRINP